MYISWNNYRMCKTCKHGPKHGKHCRATSRGVEVDVKTGRAIFGVVQARLDLPTEYENKRVHVLVMKEGE